ncbi:MAG: hypothetical protein ACLFV3_09205 [Phycisphaeraceae bacterium]
MTDTITKQTLIDAIQQIMDDRSGSAAIELVRIEHGDEGVERLRSAATAASDALDALADLAGELAGDSPSYAELAAALWHA